MKGGAAVCAVLIGIVLAGHPSGWVEALGAVLLLSGGVWIFKHVRR